MDTELDQFIKGMQTPTKKLGIKELRQREDIWRALWSWLDEDVKYYLFRIGSQFRVIKRDYKGSIGELGQVKFELKELELKVYEKVLNWNDGKWYYEEKVIKIPASSIMIQESILDQTEATEVETEEVTGLESIKEPS